MVENEDTISLPSPYCITRFAHLGWVKLWQRYIPSTTIFKRKKLLHYQFLKPILTCRGCQSFSSEVSGQKYFEPEWKKTVARWRRQGVPQCGRPLIFSGFPQTRLPSPLPSLPTNGSHHCQLCQHCNEHCQCHLPPFPTNHCHQQHCRYWCHDPPKIIIIITTQKGSHHHHHPRRISSSSSSKKESRAASNLDFTVWSFNANNNHDLLGKVIINIT